MNLVKRFTGYEKAFERYNLKIEKELVFRATFGPKGGVEAAHKIVQTNATAIIAINDDVAMGVYKGLNLLNKRIPEDYSVVGFDDISLNKYLTPSLTTMAQPINEIGEQVVGLLINRIKNPSSAKKTIILNTKLKIGDSTRELI